MPLIDTTFVQRYSLCNRSPLPTLAGIIFWFAYLKMKDDFTDWDLDYGDSPSEKLLAEESYKAARARI